MEELIFILVGLFVLVCAFLILDYKEKHLSPKADKLISYLLYKVVL